MARLLLSICIGLAFMCSDLAAGPVPDGFAELNERLSPAVVNISTAQNVEVTDEVPAFPKGSPLERFNDFFGRRNNNGRISKSLGSGFVIDADGYIVTNNHVIEESDFIEVVFQDGRTFDAAIVGRDPSTDLALLKISSGDDFPFVPWGDSEEAKVGDWVIAIGNPFGFGGSVSAGIISARNRSINQSNYDDFIQSDVAINQGNSGGPLFNMDGEVVGINTAIYSQTGGSVGISFSIPSDLAQSVIGQLREYGETRRGRLGIAVQAVSDDLAKSHRLSKPTGALVTRVVEDSPAKEAGIKVGDLVLEIGGEEVPNQRVLYRMIAEREIGKPVEILVLRKRKRKTLTATIERLKEEVTKSDTSSAADNGDTAGEALMGVHVENLTDEVRREHRIKSEVKGVRVVKVSPNSPAAGKILAGDIIEEAALEPVASIEDFKTALETASETDRPVTILINRGGNYLFYALNIS